MRITSCALSVSLLSGMGVLGVGALEACSSSGSGSTPPADAAAPVDGAADAASDATADSSTDASATAVPTYITHFDGDAGQLPEGLWLPIDGSAPLVGLAPLGTILSVDSDGGPQTFGTIGAAGSASNSFTLGITQDTAGNVYVGVGVGTTPDAGNVPAPGVYRFASDGGAALFSSAAGMKFPNGLDFIGAQLFVADSDGIIYSISPAGTPAIWSSDPLLAPDVTACDGGVPLAIGANGIAHDTTNVYVTNTNHGRVLKIPMESDGGAGAVTAIVDDCAFVGADGITMDTATGSLLVAVNAQNELVRVTTTGTTTVLAQGAPLHSPASLVVDSTGGARRLLFTNATFFGGTGAPGLLQLPLP